MSAGPRASAEYAWPNPAPLSRPRWPTTPPPPDPAATAYLLIGLGAGGGALIDVVGTQVTCPTRVICAPALAPALDDIHAAIDRMVVGERVFAIGPEHELLQLVSVLDRSGFIESEYSLCTTTAGTVTVYCAHCSVATTTTAAPGDVRPCDGCRRHLYIDPHVSRRHGGYLGTDINVEEPR